MKQYYKRFINFSLAKRWIYSLIAMMIFALIAVLINWLLKTDLINSPLDKESMTKQIILGVIIGPLFETILFFLVPYNIFRFFDCKPIPYIFTAGLLFGVCHIYSWLYIVTMCFLGIIQAQYFSIAANQRGRTIAVLLVWALHGIYNLWALFFT